MSNQIPFRVVGLQVESFQLTGNKPQSDIPVEVRTNYEFGVMPNEHLVMARLVYVYLQGEKELLQMTLVSTFDIKPDAFQTMIEGNTFTLQPYFSQYI